MLPNHATQTDPYLHEAKGATTATAGQVLTATGAGTATFQTPGAAAVPSGSVVKTETFLTVAATTGTTLIPYDDTIPQITEGNQMHAASWTPSATGNKIRVAVTINGSYSVAAFVSAALFQDATANALAAVSVRTGAVNESAQLTITFEITAASLTTTNFYVRVGGSTAGTFTLNGNAGARIFGGVQSSSIVIAEIKA